MNKYESKYFNTAIKMDEALLSLLEKKDFEYITIKEICDIAGVNRSTFYLHYENTYDLLREAAQYILDKHFSYYDVDKKDVVQRLENYQKNELVFINRGYLVPYLTFVKGNRRIFKIVIKHFHLMNMGEVHDRMFKYIFEPILVQFGVPLKERAYVIKFYLTGVFAIVMEWLDNDCKDDMDLIIKVINDCVLGARKINE
jgi:AcrR family transcriptional regulator